MGTYRRPNGRWGASPAGTGRHAVTAAVLRYRSALPRNLSPASNHLVVDTHSVDTHFVASLWRQNIHIIGRWGGDKPDYWYTSPTEGGMSTLQQLTKWCQWQVGASQAQNRREDNAHPFVILPWSLCLGSCQFHFPIQCTAWLHTLKDCYKTKNL